MEKNKNNTYVKVWENLKRIIGKCLNIIRAGLIFKDWWRNFENKETGLIRCIGGKIWANGN